MVGSLLLSPTCLYSPLPKLWKNVSCSVVSNSLWPHELQLSRFLCPWDFPGKNTRVGWHSLLQGIFSTQGLNLGLLHCRQVLHQLSHQESLCLKSAASPFFFASWGLIYNQWSAQMQSIQCDEFWQWYVIIIPINRWNIFLISEVSLKRLSSYLPPYPQGNKYSDFCHCRLVFTSSCTSCIYILWCMTSFIQHERCGFEIHPHCCMYLASLLETIRGVHWASLVAQMVKNLPAMWDTQVPEDPLEKGMATHSSILAWRIPWTEESCGLQSMGLQRVRHNCVTNAFTFYMASTALGFLYHV